MPRHDPGYPASSGGGHAARRLSAAVAGPGTDPGLLSIPPLGSGSAPPPGPEPGDPPVHRGPRLRWRTGARPAAVLCLIGAVLLGWFWWQAAHAPTDIGPLSSTGIAADGDGPVPDSHPVPDPVMSSPPATGRIIVHVAGAVVRAGVVELPPGSRLHEAIAAAGGGSPDADPGQLNLAAVLEDGQKILVPRQGETVPNGTAPAGDAAAGGGPASGARPTAAGKINLNTASVEELATLPRVGPVLAQRIVDWRGQHGRFQRVEELDAVDGVGEKMLAALLPLVRV
ncbi:helix-hairpin-helix domain-containing protein [Pseudarthrobacter sp. So.54]